MTQQRRARRSGTWRGWDRGGAGAGWAVERSGCLCGSRARFPLFRIARGFGPILPPKKPRLQGTGTCTNNKSWCSLPHCSSNFALSYSDVSPSSTTRLSPRTRQHSTYLSGTYAREGTRLWSTARRARDGSALLQAVRVPRQMHRQGRPSAGVSLCEPVFLRPRWSEPACRAQGCECGCKYFGKACDALCTKVADPVLACALCFERT